MAVRRVSELPELYSNYPDATADKCLIEVSYNPHNKVYQSFYTYMDQLLNTYSFPIPNITADKLPKASNSAFGIVKIGSNITVNSGAISIPNASASSPGVNVKPPANCTYLGSDSNGNFVQAPTPQQGGVAPFDPNDPSFKYWCISTSYPIGSIWMSANKNQIWPPGFHHKMPPDNQPTDERTVDVAAAPAIVNGVTHWIHWSRIVLDRSFWTTFRQVGQNIDGSLLESNDSGHSSRDAYVYTQSGSNRTSVRSVKPTSIGVIAWMRVDDYIG